MNSTPSSGKVEGLIEEASGRITGDSGREATGHARQGLADASRTANDTQAEGRWARRGRLPAR